MASDVYALGLLLHELLTGTHPFEAAVSTPEDMQRAILEDSPAPPSLTAGRVDAAGAALRANTAAIGRAACRERVCQYVEISVVACTRPKQNQAQSADRQRI